MIPKGYRLFCIKMNFNKPNVIMKKLLCSPFLISRQSFSSLLVSGQKYLNFKPVSLFKVKLDQERNNFSTSGLVLNIDNKANIMKFDILESKALQVPVDSQSASRIFLQVLGSGVSGNSRSLYVFTDKERFLFNFGDSSLRLCCEYNSKPFTKFNHLFGVFLTSVNCENISGLLDLREFLGQIGSPTLNVYCPQGIKEVIDKANSLSTEAKLRKCSLNINEIADRGSKECSISIDHVPIFPSVNGSNCTIEATGAETEYVMAYICHSRSNVCRELIMDKLLSYNIGNSTSLTYALKNGKSITLPSGVVVHPQDVCKIKGDAGKIFIVIDIPSKKYLNNLLSCEDFLPYQQTTSLNKNDCPEVIVHFSPHEVLSDSRYIKWVNSYSPSVTHVILNDKSKGADLRKASGFQQDLHYYFPQIFPLPDSLIDNNQLQEVPKYEFIGPVIQAQSGLKYHLTPPNKLDLTNCANNTSSSVCKESVAMVYKNVMKRYPNMEEALSNSSKPYPHVYFLGTGSTQSMALRNSTSILLDIDKDTCILLDCGAGTLNQLMRLFGRTKTLDILRKLKGIFVSHHHLDHFLGIAALLAAREQVDEINKLYIFGVSQVLKFLKLLSPTFLQLDKKILIANNKELLHRSKFFSLNFHDEICSYLQMEKIETCFVPHCHDSFGVAITHGRGWKLVYSGDTKPSERLVEIGQGCDLLIHEATLEDGLEETALDRSHSTISQAIGVGRCMKAKHVILTHFSQRYSSIPFREENFPDNVGIAFDNMRIALCDLPYLSRMYPIYKEMFIEKWENMKEIDNKRQMKQRNKRSSQVKSSSLFT